MSENRRSFLKKAGCTALGLGCGFPFVGAGCSNSGHGSDHGGASPNQWAMIVDVQKCLGEKGEELRRACIEACNVAHNVPFIPDPDNPRQSYPKEEVKWIWEADYENAFPDQTHTHTEAAIGKKPAFMKGEPVLVLCNHCTNPPCVRVCPTQATWKRESDGIVMMDMHRCIGCRYCIAACPYGARSFNWRDPREYIAKDENGELPADYPARNIGVVEKCNFCAERIRSEGDEAVPACVEAADKVQEGALTFGKLNSPKISQVLQNEYTICRRVSLGTGPNVFYIV